MPEAFLDSFGGSSRPPSTTFGQAVKNVFASLIEDIVKGIATWAIKQAEVTAMNIAGINSETAAKVAGASAGSTAQIIATAASSFAVLGAVAKSIEASAAEAFAGIFRFLSPVLGPGAAGPAAAGEAAVMAVLPSFAQRSWSLPSDMVAQVHAGEMIVPAGPAAGLRSALSGGGNTGPAIHLTYAPNIAAPLSMTPKQLMGILNPHSTEIAKMVGIEMARNQGIRGNY